MLDMTYEERQRNGFTLIELLVVIAIIAALIGTSNTILFGEVAHGALSGTNAQYFHEALQGFNITGWGLSAIDAPNSFKRTGQNGSSISAGVGAVGSFHPGGCNFGFTDGSVKFIKDSIASWPINPSFHNLPVGIAISPGFTWGSTTPMVYQALSTRDGGEVISSDVY